MVSGRHSTDSQLIAWTHRRWALTWSMSREYCICLALAFPVWHQHSFQLLKIKNTYDLVRTNINCQTRKKKKHPQNAFAIATLASTATSGTTTMPDPRSVQIVMKDTVSLWCSNWNGGSSNCGTPGSTLPDNLKGGIDPSVQRYATHDVIRTISALRDMLTYHSAFLAMRPAVVVSLMWISLICCQTTKWRNISCRPSYSHI